MYFAQNNGQKQWDKNSGNVLWETLTYTPLLTNACVNTGVLKTQRLCWGCSFSQTTQLFFLLTDAITLGAFPERVFVLGGRTFPDSYEEK